MFMANIYIVFDTNVFKGFGVGGNANPLDTTNGKVLLKLREKGKVRLFVPSVVLQEVTRQWFDEYNERKLKLEESVEKFNNVMKMADENFEPPRRALSGCSRDFFYKLAQDVLVEKGLEILPMPCVALEQVLLRDLDRRKPFNENGRGFRDSLIWESVCELHSLDNGKDFKIIFVTNDRDFLDKGLGIHEDLQKDLVSSGRDVIAVNNMDMLLKHPFIKPYVDEFQSEIRVEIEWGLKKKIFEKLEGLIDKPVSLFDYGEPGGVGGGPINTPIVEGDFVDIHVIEKSVVYETYSLNDTFSGDADLLTVKVDIDVECSIDGFVYKSDYYMYEWDLEILDQDWNDYMMLVREEKTLHFTLQGEVPNGSLSIEDVRDMCD